MPLGKCRFLLIESQYHSYDLEFQISVELMRISMFLE